jgi:hypothetical protein
MRLEFRSFLAAAFLTLAAAPGHAGDKPVFQRSPYLQFGTTNSMVVAWRTAGPVDPVVRFGERVGDLDRVAEQSNIITRTSLGVSNQPMRLEWRALRTPENLALPKLHSAPLGTFQYEVKLTGLRPATRYFYGVFDGARRLTPEDDSYSFTTPPHIGTRQPVRFWVLGDSGTGRREQADVFQAMLNTIEKERRPLDLWLHVGDMAYGSGKDVEFQSRFFKTYDRALRRFVCWPAMGNHEGLTSKGTTGIGPYYDAYVLPRRGEAGGLPSGTEAYYSFDFANIHFICLDSHDLDRKPGGAMARWLKADLEKASADWILAYWHHPPYTKGSHDSEKEKDLIEMRRYIMPIIESGGVDMVFTGHSHIYERSMLIDGSYGATITATDVVLNDGDGNPDGDGAYRKSAGNNAHEGTVQVVTGNAGQTLGRKATLPILASLVMEHGSVIVDVDGNMLTARMINKRGEPRDLFAIQKRGTVEIARVAKPRPPPKFVKPTNEVRTVSGPPVEFTTLIAPRAEWQFLIGQRLATLDWTKPEFKATNWQTGPAGFGLYGSGVSTEWTDSPRLARTVYVRREFFIEQVDRVTELGLLMNYADGFAVYVNGREAAKHNLSRGTNSASLKITQRTRGKKHEPAFFALKDAHKHLRDGTNVIAIEMHGAPGEKAELVLDPQLILED